MLARYHPQIDDYLVIQEDGYTYVNPKSVFERKYNQVYRNPRAGFCLQAATEVTPEVEAAVRDAFEYHRWTPKQIEAGTRVREALILAVMQIIRDVPPGPDRTVAIRKIREARMDANSAITHGGKY